MADYRVRFFNRLTNSYGRSFDVSQRSIDVRCDDGPDEAVGIAKRAFERAEGIGNWRARATGIDCAEIAQPADQRPAFPQMR